MNGVKLELELTTNKIWIQQDLEAIGLHANAGCLLLSGEPATIDTIAPGQPQQFDP
jgi:hypothetical protein